MKERLLQYIWQFQYFNKNSLTTISGEPLQIINPGSYNTNQGPDFLSAKIKISNTIWAGNIELHVNSSDWELHKHFDDENYKNIILHVIWNYDRALIDSAGNTFHTFELQSRVSKLLLLKYEALMKASYFIPCEKQINDVKQLTFKSWQQRILIERLQKKSKLVFDYLHKNNFHWEEAFWWILAKNFGTKINGEAFEKIALSLPLNVLAKHKNQIHHLEALLFGQAGLLENSFQDEYPSMLQKEYNFLKKKYDLKSPAIKLFFLRMRPANFPTVRLAQLAMLVHTSSHLFSSVKEADDVNEIKKLLNVTANDYWHYHYLIDESAVFKKKNLGEQMINNILINTIIPVLFTYGLYHKEENYKDKAIAWLENISPENNSVTRGFSELNVANNNAFDSQSLIELKNGYCDKKRCLECAVGNAILKTNR